MRFQRMIEQNCVLCISLVILTSSGFEFSCPTSSQWFTRARLFCLDPSKYSCVKNTLTGGFTESCSFVDFERPGRRIVLSGGIDANDCSSNRYQPPVIKYWTNMSTDCIYVRSQCSEIGQVALKFKEHYLDTTCRCNYLEGYNYINKPLNPCSCLPSREDCSCFQQTCPENSSMLSPDYQCTPKQKKISDYRCPTITVLSKAKDYDVKQSYTATDLESCSLSYVKWRKWLQYVLIGLLLCIGITITIKIIFNKYEQFLIKKDEEEADEIRKILATLQDLQIRHTNANQLDFQLHIFKEMIRKETLTDAQRYFLDKIYHWEDESVRVAILGEKGVGKSSFINCLCNLNEESHQFAKVGNTVNITNEKARSDNQMNPELELFELQGFDALDNSAIGNHSKSCSVPFYDYVLIFVGNKLSRNDINAEKRLKELNVPFSYVRSKFDKDLAINKFKQSRTIATLKSSLTKEVEITESSIFVISCHKKRMGEFYDLIRKMTEVVKELKRPTVMLSLAVDLLTSLSEMKYEIFKKRIRIITLDVREASTPSPTVKIVKCIMTIINDELLEYKKSFMFDENMYNKHILDSLIKQTARKESVFLWSETSDDVFNFLRSENFFNCISKIAKGLQNNAPSLSSWLTSRISPEILEYRTEQLLNKMLVTTKEDYNTINREYFNYLIGSLSMKNGGL